MLGRLQPKQQSISLRPRAGIPEVMGQVAGNPIQVIKKFGPELIECLPFGNFHRILEFMNPGNKYTCERIE